jgi:glucans biosynthesis protein
MPTDQHSQSTFARLQRLLSWRLAGFLLSAFGALASPLPALAFGFDDVDARARAEALEPYRAPPALAAPDLKQLTYDGYRDIRFRPDEALWRRDGLPFEVMFFHVGAPYNLHAVQINEVVDGKARVIPFDPKNYDYGKNKLSPATWGNVGHAGFRVHYPLNTTAYKDELVVFLGASYFRALGAGQHYGLSARGLAIDTVGGKGEEFPRFKEFWLVKPAPSADSLTIYALLDSPRATGAYEFVFRPGQQTITDVRSRVYLREPVATLAIAPLTSMFLHGENEPALDDFRPEVHDSDGLMVVTGEGEWLWRPLSNPARLLTTSFSMRQPKGFGLMQRDRTFASYEDIEARYDRRPSAWVEPQGDWGAGRVELMQFPTPNETHDNVVAYWVPAKLPARGEPLALAYRLHWQGQQQQRPPNGWTVQSRRGHGYRERQIDPNELQYVVDFAGPSLDGLPSDAAVDAVVTTGPNATLLERNAYRNEASGGWRMTLRLKRLQPTQPVELRAFLQHGNNALTETWTTLIQPD